MNGQIERGKERERKREITQRTAICTIDKTSEKKKTMKLKSNRNTHILESI